jgi:hypothetical protein
MPKAGWVKPSSVVYRQAVDWSCYGTPQHNGFGMCSYPESTAQAGRVDNKNKPILGVYNR